MHVCLKFSLMMCVAFLAIPSMSAQKMRLGLLVYGGGGDWYANPTALKNLARFSNTQLGTSFDAQEVHRRMYLIAYY